jgi:hypothetical protein
MDDSSTVVAAGNSSSIGAEALAAGVAPSSAAWIRPATPGRGRYRAGDRGGFHEAQSGRLGDFVEGVVMARWPLRKRIERAQKRLSGNMRRNSNGSGRLSLSREER